MVLEGTTYRASLPLSGEKIQYWIEVGEQRYLHRANPLRGYFDGQEVSETGARPAKHLSSTSQTTQRLIQTMSLPSSLPAAMMAALTTLKCARDQR